MRNMRQNMGFALVYNALGIPVAAGVLYPLTGLLLSPLISAFAMSFSSVSAVGNAQRLRSQDQLWTGTVTTRKSTLDANMLTR